MGASISSKERLVWPEDYQVQMRAAFIRDMLKFNIEMGLSLKFDGKARVDYEYGNVPTDEREWYVIKTCVLFPDVHHGFLEMTPEDINDFISRRKPYHDLIQELLRMTSEDISLIRVTNLNVTFEQEQDRICFYIYYDVYLSEPMAYSNKLKTYSILKLGRPKKIMGKSMGTPITA